MDAASEKMADIFSLTVDDILNIFRFLRIEDRIAFAFSCDGFRQLCMDKGVFRNVDLSKCMLSTKQQEVMKMFFRDRQMTQQTKALNISNLRAFNWYIDDHLQEFVVSICPHLEALHVVNCGVSLQILHCILKEASQLTALSWSLWDFKSEDIEFLLKTMKTSEGISLKNIKHLRLQMKYSSLPHIQIAQYLVLSCCRDLEELEICTWQTYEAYCTGGIFPLTSDQSIPGFLQPSDENELNNLNSLVMEPMGDIPCKELYDFVVSVVSRKSSSTKWKKFCISQTNCFSGEHFSLLLRKVNSDDFHSLEAIGANLRWSNDATNEMKTLFQGIGDNTVRSLQLCLPSNSDSIVEFCNPISRVGGHSLKFLSLSSIFSVIIRAEQNINIHTLFSNCSNITELDLLWCCFEKDICEPLSQLKHLRKLQLKECVISSKYNRETGVETSKANLLTFVENCKNITHLDVRGCSGHGIYSSFLCHLTDDDLLALAKLRNLESVTLDGIREWKFLKYISENCKFLTTIRIRSDCKQFIETDIPILMESSRFLKHLVISVDEPVLGSKIFWNFLRHAKNLERLCIKSWREKSISIPVAVETLKSLPRLHVLHLHSYYKQEDDDFYHQLIRMLEEKESDCRFSFEIVTKNGMNTWINHPTGYSSISNKALPLNKAELCDMKPILDIPMM